MQPRNIAYLCLALAVFFSIFGSASLVRRTEAEEIPIMDFFLYGQQYAVAGSILKVNYSIRVNMIVPLRFEFYGDLVLADGWTIKMNIPPSIFSKVTYYNTIDITIPSDAKNGQNGFYLMRFINGEHVGGEDIWVNVTGGKDETDKRRVYNYTAPEHSHLRAENFPRDLYVPSGLVPVTVWFTPNCSGTWKVWFYRFFSEPMGYDLWESAYFFDCEAGREYNYTFMQSDVHLSLTIYVNISVYRGSGDPIGTVYDTVLFEANTHCPPDFPPLQVDVSVTVSPDLNGNGEVDIFDIVIVAGAYGSEPEDEKWNVLADLDRNNKVDIFDVVKIAGYYGETW